MMSKYEERSDKTSMKKIKKVRSLLLALLLLSFSAFANFINVYADTVDDIVTDESVVEPMDSFEGFHI